MTGPDTAHDRWKELQRVWWLIGRLRGESGCPWDRKQTPESVQTYLVEEAHEAAAAVRAGRSGEASEELGDLLFMVFFMVYLYEEAGRFTLEDVCRLICEKMIRRHPHVFGNTTVGSSDEVKDNWEKIKADEKASSGKEAGRIPDSLPALMRAYRVMSRLSHQKGFERGDLNVELERFAASCQLLAQSLSNGDDFSPDLFGLVLLDVVNLARLLGLKAEECLHGHLNALEES